MDKYGKCKVSRYLGLLYSTYKIKYILTLKVPITTAADDIFLFIYFFYFSEKRSLDISCESILMKCQDLFSLKNKKNFRMSSVTNFSWHFKG